MDPQNMKHKLQNYTDTSKMESTSSYLSQQWMNPRDIFSFLLIVGGDVVQKALAQSAGVPALPVCFSFGWVAYAFNLIVAMTSEGRLMPDCDFHCKVINLGSGYSRDCRSWILGKFLVDDLIRAQREPRESKTTGALSPAVALHVNVFAWQRPGTMSMKFDWRRPCTLFIMAAQLGIAAIPWTIWDDWGVFLITSIGTAMAILTALLPQWTAEKFSCRTESNTTVAITPGNGSTHVSIVQGLGIGLNLEDLASGRGPLMDSTWSKLWLFSYAGKPDRRGRLVRHARLLYGVPVGLWVTRLASLFLSAASVTLLIAATGLEKNAWFLFAVGALGMLQNAIIAGSTCLPQHRGLDLMLASSFAGSKVMDVLMDLDLVHHGYGEALLEEFFPQFREHTKDSAELEWWAGNRTVYDGQRTKDQSWRGLPGSTRLILR